MNKDGHIDLEKVSASIETLTSIENIINVVDLSDSFEDIEKTFRQVNFEHANCLNYKEPLETIYTDLETIKKKVNELAEALRRTKLNYTKIDTFTDGDIKELTDIYKTTPASEELSKLVGTENKIKLSDLTADLANTGTVTTVPVPEPDPVQEKEPINTVPIGIAIGATGIAGSVGAVIVDDIYSKKNKKRKKVEKDDVYIAEYNEADEIDEPYDYDQIRKAPDIAQGPYRAARLQREADRFYGNELHKLDLEDNNDDEEYLDEDDDEYEDF